MTNRTKPAYTSEGRMNAPSGLTKRELFAAMAMQGLLASGKAWNGPMGWIGEESVRVADSLLETLEKTA